MPYSLIIPSACDLHIPHKQQLITATDADLRRMEMENWKRVEHWANHFRRNCSSGTTDPEINFSHPGTLNTSLSTPYRWRQDVTLVRIDALLTTAGSDDTVVRVYNNGSIVVTITLGASVTATSSTTLSNASFTAFSNLLSAEIITTGTNAAGLTVSVFADAA
jgi:hypothetical protein